MPNGTNYGVSLDRFDGHITEPDVTCEGCGASRPIGDILYDEHAEIYVCDRACFDDWNGYNMAVIGDYYYRMNVET